MGNTHVRRAGQRWASTMRAATGGILALVAVLALGGAAFADASPQSGQIVVPRDFPTIQAAVDAAARGATITVRPGTYTEELVIAKDLTIEGAGVGATIVKAPPALTPFAQHLLSGLPVAAVVRVTDGARVHLSRLTVEGLIPCAVEGAGVRVVKDATLGLSNARVTRIRPEGGPCPPQSARGQGVVIGLPGVIALEGQNGSTAHGTITDVTVDQYHAAGITVVGPAGRPPSTATVARNVVTGGALLPVGGQLGIRVSAAAVARVTENTVRGNVCTAPFCGPDPINQALSAGIFLESIGVGGSRIWANRVADIDAGIYQFASADCCTISGNQVTDNRFFGIVIQDGNGGTAGNTISGGQVGIAVVADFIDTVALLRADEISQTSVARVQELECCGFNATAVVRGG